MLLNIKYNYIHIYDKNEIIINLKKIYFIFILLHLKNHVHSNAIINRQMCTMQHTLYIPCLLLFFFNGT